MRMCTKYLSAALRNKYSTPTPNVVSKKIFKKYLLVIFQKQDVSRGSTRIIVRTMEHEKSLLLQTPLQLQPTYQIQGLLSLRSDSPKIVAAKRLREWMTTPPTICLLTSYNLIHSIDKGLVSGYDSFYCAFASYIASHISFVSEL